MEIRPGVTCWFIPEGFECEIVRPVQKGENVIVKSECGAIFMGKVRNDCWEIDKIRRSPTNRGYVILQRIALNHELIPLGYNDKHETGTQKHDAPKKITS